MFDPSNIKFRTINKKDLKLILYWRNSNFIRFKMLNQKKILFKEHRAWFKNQKKNLKNKTFIICYNNNDIGVASINEIDRINKTCTWGYYIAENKFRYLAFFVEYKLVDQIFNKINIRKIWGRTLVSNKRVLKIHNILGFKKEGLHKEHIKVKNKYEDVVLTSLFKKDWNKNKTKISRKFNI